MERSLKPVVARPTPNEEKNDMSKAEEDALEKVRMVERRYARLFRNELIRERLGLSMRGEEFPDTIERMFSMAHDHGEAQVDVYDLDDLRSPPLPADFLPKSASSSPRMLVYDRVYHITRVSASRRIKRGSVGRSASVYLEYLCK